MKESFKFVKKVFRWLYFWMIDNIICKLFLLFPVRRRIMFESVPDLSDSTKAVFEEMIRRGLNKEYEMIWLIHGEERSLPNILNVKYIYEKRSRLVVKYYEYTSCCLVSCNMFLLSHSKRQKSFYISHGSTLKAAGSYYFMPNEVDYYLSASEDAGRVLAKMMRIPPDKEIHLGLPRNDVFNQPRREITQFFPIKYKKMVIWYPTFRQHKAGGHNSAATRGLPLLHDIVTAQRLNEFVKEREVLIVLKPHFAQDLNYIKELNLSNIVFIDDSFFVKNCISSYELVNVADALVSDYSSIYYDYLLTDRPIALIWEDIEEYKSDPGFEVDITYYCKAATKVYSVEEFEMFIQDLVDGRDILQKERNEICTLMNYSLDGQNTRRVVDFICEKTGLK